MDAYKILNCPLRKNKKIGLPNLASVLFKGPTWCKKTMTIISVPSLNFCQKWIYLLANLIVGVSQSLIVALWGATVLQIMGAGTSTIASVRFVTSPSRTWKPRQITCKGGAKGQEAKESPGAARQGAVNVELTADTTLLWSQPCVTSYLHQTCIMPSCAFSFFALIGRGSKT